MVRLGRHQLHYGNFDKLQCFPFCILNYHYSQWRMLGDKGNALRTVGKGVCTGHKDVPVDG